MQIDVLNSGSDGNGYVIHTRTECLLIECGVKAREMLKAVNFNTMIVSGCIVSHCHMDHIKYLPEYLKYGFPIYMTPEASGIETRISKMKRMSVQRIGGFEVVPFRVPHNETACDGFVIKHTEFGTLLFLTDAEMCPYDLGVLGINHCLIECNYSIDNLEVTDANKVHVLRGHMEFGTCKRFLETIYSPSLYSIGLIHLSSVNGDPERFQREIQDAFPSAKVWVATKNHKEAFGNDWKRIRERNSEKNK